MMKDREFTLEDGDFSVCGKDPDPPELVEGLHIVYGKYLKPVTDKLRQALQVAATDNPPQDNQQPKG